MTLVPCDISEIKKPRNKYSEQSLRRMILEQFSEGHNDCVEVIDFYNNSAKSCAWSLTNSIRIYNLNGIKATLRGNHVYLVKTAALSKLEK